MCLFIIGARIYAKGADPTEHDRLVESQMLCLTFGTKFY